jgi:hypothetical protein
MTLFGFYLHGTIIAKVYTETEGEARDVLSKRLFDEFGFDDRHIPYQVKYLVQKYGWPTWRIENQQEVIYSAILSYQCS